MGVFVFSLDVCPALKFKRKLFITKTYLTGEHFCKDTAPFFVRIYIPIVRAASIVFYPAPLLAAVTPLQGFACKGVTFSFCCHKKVTASA